MTPLHYRVAGDNRDAPLLFLHGFMGSHADWDVVIDALRGDHLCIAVDLPGHGRSVGRAAPEGYTIEAAARGATGVLDTLELPAAVWVGYSMGGRVALYAAVRSPERCRALVLESASPGLATEAERSARRRIDEGRAARLEAGFPSFLEAWYQSPMFAPLDRHPDVRKAMLERRLRNDPAELARALAGMSVGRQPSLWGRLPELRMPVLALAGAEDEKYAEIASRIAGAAEPARKHLVSGAGHNVHLERPDAFVEALRRLPAAHVG